MLGDIRIERSWEVNHDLYGSPRPGRQAIAITITNADATPDRAGTVQAIEDLLMALIKREHHADEAQQKARDDKAKAARLRAEAAKLDPQESTELDRLHVKVSVDASEIECYCCSCRSDLRECCHCGRFDDDY